MKKLVLLLLLLVNPVFAVPDFFPLEGYALNQLLNQMPLSTNIRINNSGYVIDTFTFGPPGNTGYYSVNNLLANVSDNVIVTAYNTSHYGINNGSVVSLSEGITRINVTVNTLRSSELSLNIVYPEDLDHITPGTNFSLNVSAVNVGWDTGANCYINLSIQDTSVISTDNNSSFISSMPMGTLFNSSFNMSALSFGSTNITALGVCGSDSFYVENSFEDSVFLYVDSPPPSNHFVEGYVFNSDLSMASSGVSVTVTSLTTGDVEVTQTFGPPGNTGYYSVNNLLAFDGEIIQVTAESGLSLGINNGSALSLAEGITRINVTMNLSSGIDIYNVSLDDSTNSPSDEIILTPNSLTSLTCNASIQNGGGPSELNVVNATIYQYISGNNGVENNNSLYKNSSCSFVSAVGDVSNYTCGFKINYFANNGTWTCDIYAETNSFQSSDGYDNSTILPLYSFELSDNILDYGNVSPGGQSSELSLNVTNSGNMNLSLYLWGYGGLDNVTGLGNAFVCPDNNISIGFHRYSLSPISYASKNFLTSSSTFSGLDVVKRTNSQNSTNSTFWQMSVPDLDPIIGIGQCNGTVVFEAFS